MNRSIGWTLGLALLAAATARADLDVTIGNGDVVKGTLLPATETETFRVACPAGAKLTASIKSGKAKAAVVVRVVGPDGLDVASKGGRSARLKGLSLATSGEYRVIVSSLDRVTSDDYTLTVGWKSARGARSTVLVSATATGEFTFAADAGADVALSVSAAKKSPAKPFLARITDSDGTVTTIHQIAKTTFHATAADTYTVTFENDAAVAGDVVASAQIKPPKAPKRKLAATTREIPPGTTVVAAAVMDRSGGTLDAPTYGALGGMRITIPVGALTKPAVVVLGTASDVTPRSPLTSTRATSAALVGPLGRALVKPISATVLLPYDPSVSAPGDQSLRVYATFDASNAVDQIASTSLDPISRRVSFAASRFARFQGYFVKAGQGAPPVTAAGAVSDRLGESVAVDGDFVYAGAPGAAGPAGEVEAGVVRVYQRVGADWIERSPIYSPTPQAGERFGTNMSLQAGVAAGGASRLIVAAPQRTIGASAYAGGVHVLVGSGLTWTLETMLVPPSSSTDSALFGMNMAADADSLIVTSAHALYYTTGQLPPGLTPVDVAAAGNEFSFTRTAQGWTLDQAFQLGSSSPGAGMAVHGDDLFIGVPFDRDAEYPSGGVRNSIHVFSRVAGKWAPAGMIREPETVDRINLFGDSIAIVGDTMITGSRGVVRNSGVGAIYLSSRASGWALDTRIDGGFGDFALAAHGSAFVAASRGLSWAYVYRLEAGAWTQTSVVDVMTPLGRQNTTTRVAFDGAVFVIGAPDVGGTYDDQLQRWVGQHGAIGIFPAQ